MIFSKDEYIFNDDVGNIKPKTCGVPGMVYIERIDRVFAGERWGDTSRKAAGDRVQIGKSHANLTLLPSCKYRQCVFILSNRDNIGRVRSCVSNRCTMAAR